jgi:hypothetical protein
MLKKVASIILFLLVYININAQKNIETNNLTNEKKALHTLIVKLLNWSKNDKNRDFVVNDDNPKDSILRYLNWDLQKKRIKELEKTTFFTKAFLANYQKIATHLAKQLKQNKEAYVKGDIPPYLHDGNGFCGCQDYPENIQKDIKITGLKLNGDKATFSFSWLDGNFNKTIAVKQNNIWKIDFLESFTTKEFTW